MGVESFEMLGGRVEVTSKFVKPIAWPHCDFSCVAELVTGRLAPRDLATVVLALELELQWAKAQQSFARSVAATSSRCRGSAP